VFSFLVMSLVLVSTCKSNNSVSLVSWDTSKSKLNPVLDIGRCLDSDFFFFTLTESLLLHVDTKTKDVTRKENTDHYLYVQM